MEKKVIEISCPSKEKYYSVGTVGAVLTASTGNEVFLFPYDDFEDLVDMDLASIKAYLCQLKVEPGDYVEVDENVIQNTETGTKYIVGSMADYKELLEKLDEETRGRKQKLSPNFKRVAVAALIIAALAVFCTVNNSVKDFEEAAARFEKYKASNPGVFESDSIGIAYENPISGRTFSIGGKRS